MSAPGDWPSGVTAEIAARGGPLRLGDLRVIAGAVYWTEARPAESGRNVIVRHSLGRTEDVLPAPWSARSSVHEYGGAPYTVHDDVVYFSSSPDGHLWRLHPGAPEPAPVNTAPHIRFADFVVDAGRRRLISVVEDHRDPARVANFLGAVPLQGGRITPLVGGADFYAAPRISPDGGHLAWLSWDLPAMPWDATTLSVAAFTDDATLGEAEVIAGAGGDESVLSPAWSPEGRLHFVSDRSGWWNLFRAGAGEAVALAPMEADCGLPPWVFGHQPYAFLRGGGIAVAGTAGGRWRLFLIDPVTGRVEPRPQPFTELGEQMSALGDDVVTLAGGPEVGAAVVRIESSSGAHQVVRAAAGVEVGAEHLSTGEPITFASDGATAHAVFYPPRNPDAALAGAKPPLVVRAHGGPTSQTRTSLDMTVQYFTSRGFAFCDVDYRGSTGYGRAYRRALLGGCGVVDVADCLAAARHLAESGAVDGDRMFIRGGSAGGHIALLAVCGHRVFAAASSHFGVADPLSLIADTHKFESRYYDSLIGAIPGAEALYRERSPLRRVDEITVPVMLFQGLDDAIVPPSQTQAMLQALRRRAVPAGYIAFEGEAHGFRRAETIVRVLQAELWFFQRVMGFPAEMPDVGLDVAGF